MRQTILIVSAITGSLLIRLNIRKLSVLYSHGQEDIWTTVFAVACIVRGILLSRVLFIQRKSEQQTTGVDLSGVLNAYGITQREYEVLKLVAEGHSNLEISKALFISESTVKTHVSSMMTKLEAKRRTQAVRRAKELQIL
jgi:DNA-binding NarL/FixJ family response regulator